MHTCQYVKEHVDVALHRIDETTRCARLQHSEMGGVHSSVSVEKDAHGRIGSDDIGCEKEGRRIHITYISKDAHRRIGSDDIGCEGVRDA